MSHELEDNLERRAHILAKMRQHGRRVPLLTLHRIIMDMGYNLRGAKEKVRELHHHGDIKEQNGYWIPADALKREEGRRKVKQGSVQEDDTRQEES
jgi:hypothetical protein